MASFDLDQVRLQPKRNRPAIPETAIPCKRTGEAFLRGPIPLEWLAEAANLPGKALHVSMALWYRASLKKNGTISLGNGLLAGFGVKPDAKRRALLELEEAGLIKVTRQKSRNPLVTLLPHLPDGEKPEKAN